MAKPIEMPVGPKELCIRWGADPQGKGQFFFGGGGVAANGKV